MTMVAINPNVDGSSLGHRARGNQFVAPRDLNWSVLQGLRWWHGFAHPSHAALLYPTIDGTCYIRTAAATGGRDGAFDTLYAPTGTNRLTGPVIGPAPTLGVGYTIIAYGRSSTVSASRGVMGATFATTSDRYEMFATNIDEIHLTFPNAGAAYSTRYGGVSAFEDGNFHVLLGGAKAYNDTFMYLDLRRGAAQIPSSLLSSTAITNSIFVCSGSRNTHGWDGDLVYALQFYGTPTSPGYLAQLLNKNPFAIFKRRPVPLWAPATAASFSAGWNRKVGRVIGGGL